MRCERKNDNITTKLFKGSKNDFRIMKIVLKKRKHLFPSENGENISKVLSASQYYIRSPKIIFEKKAIFGLTGLPE